MGDAGALGCRAFTCKSTPFAFNFTVLFVVDPMESALPSEAYCLKGLSMIKSRAKQGRQRPSKSADVRRGECGISFPGHSTLFEEDVEGVAQKRRSEE